MESRGVKIEVFPNGDQGNVYFHFIQLRGRGERDWGTGALGSIRKRKPAQKDNLKPKIESLKFSPPFPTS